MSTDPETKLRGALAAGQPCVFPEGERIRVDAKLLRAILLDESDKATANNPMEVVRAHIAGALDLSAMTISRRVSFEDCDFDESINLMDARAATIRLDRCRLAGIEMDRAQIDGSLLVRSCSFSRMLKAIGAVLSGDLDLRNSRFGRNAPILADRSRIGGAVFLNNGFQCERGVTLHTARIGLALHGANAIFRARDEPAIVLHAAEIGGSCDFVRASIISQTRDALAAEGVVVKHFLSLADATVRGRIFLRQAQISGTFNATGASFDNPGGMALDLERARITGDVFLRARWDERDGTAVVRAPFRVSGGIMLTAASIGGSLIIEHAEFHNDHQERLLFNRMNVTGVLRFTGGRVGNGLFSLSNAKVFALADKDASWPAKGLLELNGFDYGAFTGEAPTGWRERLDWVRRHRSSSFNPQPYTQLIGTLRRTGHERAARCIAIERERAAGRAARGWRKLGYWFMEATCGHGYRPWMALGWGIAVIAIGALVFNYARVDSMPLKDAAAALHRQKLSLPSDYPPFNPVVLSADAFLPIVNLGQKEYWSFDASKKRGGRAAYYRMLHIALGWFFTTLFVIGVTGLIRKE